jgi:RHS repeat-associated protein
MFSLIAPVISLFILLAASVSAHATAPVISSLSPTSGESGTAVTVTGSNFGSTKGSSTVTFGGIAAQTNSWSSTSIVAVVPSNVANSAANVQVTVGGTGSNSVSFTVTNPAISTLSTNSAPVEQEITINGGNFGSSEGSSTVMFNGVQGFPTVWSATSLTVPVPTGATTGNIVVTVNGIASSGVAFMVVPAPQAGGVGLVQGNYSNAAQCDGLGSTVLIVPFPLLQNSGDMNVVIVSWRESLDLPVITVGDGLNNQYLPATTITSQSGNGEQRIFYAPNITGGENSIIVAFGARHVNTCVVSPDVRIAEYRGLATGSPFNPPDSLDVAAATSTSGATTCDSGFATTANSNDLLVGGNLAGKTTSVAGANYTNRLITTPSGDILEDRIVTATGRYHATATMSASGNCIMGMVAFKEAQNQAPVVNAGPTQTVTLPTNSVMLVGTVTDDGLPNNTLTISWSKVSGPGTVTFSSPSTASTQATFPIAGTYVLQLSANDTELTGSSDVTVTVNSVATSVVLSPTLAGPDVTGTTQTMSTTVTSGNTPVSGASVQFTVTGANATNGNATTNSAGIATFSYNGPNQGTDAVHATSNGATSNTASIAWITPIKNISTTSILGRFFAPDANECGNGSFDTPSTAVPVFTEEFPTINFNPPANTIPGNTSNVGINTRPFTDVTTDQNGNYTGTIIAQGNGIQAGIGNLSCFQAVFTGSFTVATAGNIAINLFNDDGFTLGVNGGAAHVSGPMIDVPTGGVTPFQHYTVVGSYNQASEASGNVEVVNFPAPGTYQYELDYTECCGGQLALTMAVGATNSTGAAPTGALYITPSTPASIQTGQVETLTVQATDGAGLPVPNLSLAGIVNGATYLSLSATTNSNGQATFQYIGLNGGTDTVQAVANISNMAAFSNIVSVPWTLATGGNGTNFAPQGWISMATTTVQGMEPISVSSGITLASGTLEYWPTSNPNAITVLNSNTTGNGLIGTFDGTALPSGGYVIQLTATSSAGVAAVSVVPVVVTGELKPGRVTETITDLKIPLAGIPISITRTYDSLARGISGDFGNGWSLATGVGLTIDSFDNVTFTFNQQNITFDFVPQPTSWLFPSLLSPVYAPAPGNHGSLTSNGCNQLVQVQSNVVCFLTGSPYQPTMFTYTDPAGRVYTITAAGQLQSIKDLNGNTLTVATSGITSSAGGGVLVPFVRDGENRITKITDLNGNNYTYSYDSPCGTGNLCSVTSPGVTTPGTYTYTADHNIATQVDPNGNTTTSTYYVTADYKNGRLKSVTGPSITGSNGSPTQYVTQYDYNLCFGCGILPTNDIQTYVTNPDGGSVVTNYDRFGKPLNVTDALGRITSYIYDAQESLISMTDPLNAVTTYTYDANGFQTSVTDPLQHKSTQINNQFGGILTATDGANANTQTATYDANFNLVQVTDLENGPNSPVLSRTYDAMGDVLTNTDANGKTTQYQYDPRGNVIQVTDALNEVTRLSYDPMDRIVSRTDPRGNVTQSTYDALGNLKTHTDPLKNVTSYTYDANGNKSSETDALQRTVSFQSDNLNRLTQITYPTSPATTRQFTYDFRNNKLTETDQSGRVTKYVYDRAGQLTGVTYAYGTSDAGTVQYTYDADGRQKTVKDELGNTTTNTYDTAGRLTSVQDATSNPPTSVGYDADNRKTSVQDPNGNTIGYAYYPRNWLKTITYPATATQPVTTTQYTYDGMGHVLTTTDQASKVTTDGYDAVGRLTSVTDALSKTTQYYYDLSSNLQYAQDAAGRITTYQYDPLNRLSIRTLPLNSLSEIYTHDPVGNLAAKQDFNGKIATYSYDNLNRLLQKIPDSSLGQPTIAFTYTPTGKRATMIDGSGTTNYPSYDNRDRLKTMATPEGTLSYAYDAHGNMLTMVSSNTNGASLAYTYDVLNRLSKVCDNRIAPNCGSAGTTTYSYDAAGNPSGYGYPNTVQTANAFDTQNRLTQTCEATSSPACSASQKLASYAYTLGYAGNRTNVAELSGRNVVYGYDNDYRLQSESITSDPGGNNGAESYTYDAVGNRQTLTSTIPSLPGGMNYFYDANDRLTTDTYDNDGNTISSGGTANTYDFENRILTYGAVSIVYDGDGNRVSETAGGTTTKYLVDALNPTGYSQVMDELVNGSVTRTYAYGLQRISENQLIGGTWTPSFYGYDGHGSVRFLGNTAGTVTDTYQFDAFGAQIASTGTTPNPYLYSGERFDSNLNLYQLRARFYNMLTGRFETMDPYTGKIIDPATLHKYVYTRNNPVNRLDASGKDDWVEQNLLKGISSRTLLSVFTGLSHASRIAYVGPEFCTALAALWAVENQDATALQIVAYESACLSYLVP